MEYMSSSLRLVLAIMCKHEVVHKSRSKHRIATSPENRATATGKVNVKWPEQQNYHEGAVESQNYVRKRLTKVNVLRRRRKTRTDGDDWTSDALTLLVGWQERHPACKKTEWWGAGVVICLELGADLHMAQQMPLPLTVSCFS